MTIPDLRPCHALVLSFPMQGHITPLMQLSRRLVRSGFLITFVITDFTSARSPKSRTQSSPFPDEETMKIRVVGVPDGLPPDHPRDRGFQDQEQAMEGMRKPVEQLLEEFQKESSPITCIISDLFVLWSYEVAKRFELPLVLFYTANATSGSVLYHTRELVDKGILPFKVDNGFSNNAITCIPGVVPLRPDEFPPSMQSPHVSSYRFQFTLRMFEHIHESAGLLLNTIYELEQRVIDAMQDKTVPVYPVGPLLLPSGDEAPPTEPEVTFWQEEDRCLTWLDTHSTSSVLYVSFGSIATYSEHQFKELALGLEASQQPFLWVIRPDAIHGSISKALPEGFLDRTKDRRLIVSWSPQLRVLAHPAVGGFLSHCGWNSILESISIGGIPMICWPDIADQMVNRRLLVDEWKVGVEFHKGEDGIVDKEEVARVVRDLLQGEAGRERRARAGELKDLARRVMREGGSSFTRLEAFVDSMRGKMK